jgi:hypothetical protein
MLQCEEQNGAMQTNGLYWYLVYINLFSLSRSCDGCAGKGKQMSKSAAFIAFAPSSNPIGRLFAAIDRVLLAYAKMTIRNGDVPRCIL